MSDEKDKAKETEAAAEAEKEGEAPKSKKKLIFIGIGALLLLLIIGGGAFFFMSKSHAPAEEKPEEKSADKHATDSRRGKNGDKAGDAKDAKAGGAGGAGGSPVSDGPSYMDLQEFLVNLNTGGKQTSFLKLVVTLEIPDAETKQAVETNMPRIRDSFQVYLRELRTEDLRGSAGLQLLREELLLRINKIITPAKIDDVLFKEIIVQ